MWAPLLDRRPPPIQPTNSTALYGALRRDFIFIERLSLLLFRSAVRCIQGVQGWIARAIGFPPRVMVVSLTGVIASDDEVRYTSQALMREDEDELLLSSVDGGRLEPRVRSKPDTLINLERCERQLEKAFTTHGVRAVCLLINSPGGSPAQSSLIYQRLCALKKRHKKVPLLAFVEDAAVSGGYYIAW